MFEVINFLKKHKKDLRGFSALLKSWADTIDDNANQLEMLIEKEFKKRVDEDEKERAEILESDPNAEFLNGNEDGTDLKEYYGA